MKTKQIEFNEREYIEFLRNDEGESVKKIAKILKRSKSSISEELTFNLFMRCRDAYVQQLLQCNDPIATINRLRELKNNF